jgi:hypothetical protein
VRRIRVNLQVNQDGKNALGVALPTFQMIRADYVRGFAIVDVPDIYVPSRIIDSGDARVIDSPEGQIITLTRVAAVDAIKREVSRIHPRLLGRFDDLRRDGS